MLVVVMMVMVVTERLKTSITCRYTGRPGQWSLMARIKDHLSIENLHTENHSLAGITYLENDLNKILLNWGTIVQRLWHNLLMTRSISYFVLFHLGFYDDEMYSCFDFWPVQSVPPVSGLSWSDNDDHWNWLNAQRLFTDQLKCWIYQVSPSLPSCRYQIFKSFF